MSLQDRPDPMLRGTSARALMLSAHSNPYPPGSTEAAEWQAGWTLAADLEQEMEDDERAALDPD